MRLTFLGTGTSFGVPVVGCDCATCTSDDPRDRRTRHGAIVDTGQGRLLVDTPPELRLQLLAAGVDSVQAVWLTHDHADHLHGIDDVAAIARVAEEMDHHPDIDIRWRNLTFRLSTHSAQGVTGLDIALAERIDALVDAAP